MSLRLASRTAALALPRRLVTSTLPRSSSATVLLLNRQASSTLAPASSPTNPGAEPASLSNIEAAWEGLTPAVQQATFESLTELQKTDWNEMSLDEKKAAYYIAFGPHGPRKPHLEPGSGFSIFLGTVGLISAGAAAFFVIRMFGAEKPRTMTKEWQEASNERGRQERRDPFTGISSEGYKGKGYVTAA